MVVYRTVFEILTHNLENGLFSPLHPCLMPHSEKPVRICGLNAISQTLQGLGIMRTMTTH